MPEFATKSTPSARLEKSSGSRGKKVPTDGGLVLFAEISFKPEHYEAGRTAIEQIIPLTLQEPGCHIFSLLDSQSDDGTVYLFEIFEHVDALQYHMDQAYTKEVFASYENWLTKPVEVTRMRAALAISREQFQ